MIVKVDSNDKIHVSNGLAAKSTTSNSYHVRVDKEDDKLLLSIPDFDHFEPTLTNGTVLPQTSNLYINFRDKTNNLSWTSQMYSVKKSETSNSDMYTFELGLKKIQDYYELRWNLYKNGEFIRSSGGSTGQVEEELYLKLLEVTSTNLASVNPDNKPGFNVCIWGLANLYIAYYDDDGYFYWGFNNLNTQTPRMSGSGYHFVEVLPDYDNNPNYISYSNLKTSLDDYIIQTDAAIDEINDDLIAVGADVENTRSLYVSR